MNSDVDLNSLEQHILDLRESASNEASSVDILYELLLKQGYSLSANFKEIQIDELQILEIENGLVFAYLNQAVKPTLKQLREVVMKKPARLIVLEDCFQGDDELKTNLVQECKALNVELWTA